MKTDFRPRRSPSTITDVAHAAGVSVSTVSRVINDKDDVSPETRAKVALAAQNLRYRASLAAKGMRSRTTDVIGLVLPEVTEPFELEVIKGVGAAIRGSGFDLLIYSADDPPLSRRPSWEQEHVALLSRGLTGGTIVVSPTTPLFPDDARTVVIDPQSEGADVPSVVATNRAGALSAVEHLTSLGHRRIGFIGGRSDALSANHRFEGYTAALRDAGINFDPSLVQEGDFTRESARKAAHVLLGMVDRPTAVFAVNDESALGVMDVAQARGIRVPDDLSLVGFDDIPEASQVSPRLTTVDQSIQEMGTLAAKTLIRWLQGDIPESSLVVPTRLVIRESCRPVNR